MRKRIFAFNFALIFALFLVLTLLLAVSTAFAEEDELFIICDPKSHVNVRRSPNMDGEEIGWLEFGDMVWTDGVKKNGFIHCFLNIESGEGWVYAKYLIDEKPTQYGGKAVIRSNGRVACRRFINGKRQGWLKPNQSVTVLAYTTEWALTKRGYVMTEYLEIEP